MIIGVSGSNFMLQKKVLMGVSNDWRFVICKLVAGVGVVQSCLVGHVAIAYRHFEVFTSSYQAFSSACLLFKV